MSALEGHFWGACTMPEGLEGQHLADSVASQPGFLTWGEVTRACGALQHSLKQSQPFAKPCAHLWHLSPEDLQALHGLE